MTTLLAWIEVCSSSDIDTEDVIRFDHGERTFAIYRSEEGDFYATDGYCTHEKVHLEGGLVMGSTIECPKHNGRFNITTGEPVRKPACKALQTYPVKVQDDKVYIQLD